MKREAQKEEIRLALRALPGVDTASDWEELAELPTRARAAAIRELLDEIRAELLSGQRSEGPTREEIVAHITRRFYALARPSLKPVINATGVLLHTNLGRAPLPSGLVEAIVDSAGFTNLEYDLELGVRGGRAAGVNLLLRVLSGAEAALVVNNCAAAVLLCVSSLAEGQEVVVSRGELVEIGGSFRVPDVISRGGAILREVGTTNRTHARDYEAAIGPRTAGLLKAHASNFEILGFTKDVDVAELVDMARRHSSEEHKIYVIEDLGSASFLPLSEDGSVPTPTPLDALEAGADIVCFSGDKLVGGPQAGIILGSREAVGAARRHPLYRALRPGKLTLAALEATLRLHLDPSKRTELPLHSMASTTVDELRVRAEGLIARLELSAGVEVGWIESDATVGGGSIPGQILPSVALRVRESGRESSTLAAELRQGPRPIVGRVKDGALLLDLRSVEPRDDDAIVERLNVLFGGRP